MGIGTPKMPDGFEYVTFLDTLSGGDVTKYDYISNMDYVECLVILTYRHFKDKYNEQINKRLELQRKASR